MISLAERLQEVWNSEAPTGCVGPREGAKDSPKGPRGENLTTFELDLRDWGLIYGLAYGIARGEDPYESNDSVARRALDVARMVRKDWAGEDAWVEEPEVAA